MLNSAFHGKEEDGKKNGNGDDCTEVRENIRQFAEVCGSLSVGGSPEV
jgi:hypothetical protein